jgi:hypothetical protein
MTTLKTLLTAAALSTTALISTAHAGICDNGVCNTYESESDDFGNSRFGADYRFYTSIKNRAGELQAVEDIIETFESFANDNPAIAAVFEMQIAQFERTYDMLDAIIPTDYFKAKAYGNVGATVFSDEIDIITASASVQLDNGTFNADLSLDVLGADIALPSLSTSSVNLYEAEMTFFEARTTFMAGPIPLTVTGDVTGTLGVDGSLDTSSGLTLGVDPYAALTAGASVSVGAACVRAGVRGSIDLINVGMENTLKVKNKSCGIYGNIDSSVGMTTMDGSIEIFAEACFFDWDKELVSWDGINLGTLDLVDTSFCF